MSRDPVLTEIYEALAYHQHTAPGSLIEMGCQRCAWVQIGGSPKRLAEELYEHMKKRHPEAWKEEG